jgi:hypothetical protein
MNLIWAKGVRTNGLIWLVLFTLCLGSRPSFAHASDEDRAKQLLVMITATIDGHPQDGAGIIVAVGNGRI